MENIDIHARMALVPTIMKRPIPYLSGYVAEVLPVYVWQKEKFSLLHAEAVKIMGKVEVIGALVELLDSTNVEEKEIALLDLKFLDTALYFCNQPVIPELRAFIKNFADSLGLPMVLTYEELIMVNPMTDLRTFGSGEEMRLNEALFYVTHNAYEPHAERMIAILQKIIDANGQMDTEELLEQFEAEQKNAVQTAVCVKSPQLDTYIFNLFRGFLGARPDFDCSGPSGAFTASIPIIDLLYSGNHLPKDRFDFYKKNMIYYPRPAHSFMQSTMEKIKTGGYTDLIDLAEHSPSCKKLADVCYRFLTGFRNMHLKMVEEHLPEVFKDEKPGTMGLDKNVDNQEIGTGTFLRNRLDETPKCPFHKK